MPTSRTPDLETSPDIETLRDTVRIKVPDSVMRFSLRLGCVHNFVSAFNALKSRCLQRRVHVAPRPLLRAAGEYRPGRPLKDGMCRGLHEWTLQRRQERQWRTSNLHSPPYRTSFQRGATQTIRLNRASMSFAGRPEMGWFPMLFCLVSCTRAPDECDNSGAGLSFTSCLERPWIELSSRLVLCESMANRGAMINQYREVSC